MRTYRKVQKIDNYRCEDYLHQVTNIRHRTTMTKLWLSNHRLAIETGRYMRPYKKPNERICPLCKKEAEDEKHFLVSCPGYQEKRKSLFECLFMEFKIPIGKMSTENIFLLLLNPQVIMSDVLFQYCFSYPVKFSPSLSPTLLTFHQCHVDVLSVHSCLK